MARNRRTVGTLIVFAVALSSCGLIEDGSPGRVDIMSVEDFPDGIGLVIASCNGAPVATVGELQDGQYEVEVRTTQQWEVGNDCADGVVLDLEDAPANFEIVDVSSGEVFPYPPVPEVFPPSVDMSGEWRMVEVDGAPVEIGVNTIEIPLFEIEAGFLSGQFGCNAGGAELLIDGNQVRGFLESTQELCSIPDGSEELIPTERILTDMLDSDEGATVEVDGDAMTWTQDRHELVFERTS